MKKIFLIISFLLINVYTVLSEDCEDVTCPEGWSQGETGWVQIQLNNEQPAVFCVGKVCYCYDLDSLYLEKANFWIKKIIWYDDCYEENYEDIDIEVLKESIISEFIRIHQNEVPIRFCPSNWLPCELYTSFCYATAYHNNCPVSLPCAGDGYCSQLYRYCWDNSYTPWLLVIEKLGGPTIYDNSDCSLPFILGPNWQLIEDCLPWCY